MRGCDGGNEELQTAHQYQYRYQDQDQRGKKVKGAVGAGKGE
jgi:hypothetical protein